MIANTFPCYRKYLRRRQTTSPAKGWRRQGSIAVEAAVCLPLLAIVFIGLADAGRTSHTCIAVSNACRIGADFAATNRDTELFEAVWQQKVREYVLRELETIPGNSEQKVNLTIQRSGDLQTRRFYVVEVTYRFDPLFSWPGRKDGIVIHDRRTMVNYR